MNRKLVVAALALAASGATFAQSSVSIYGRLNLSVERQKTGTAGAIWNVQNSSSRLGFRGTEDLGSGLKAGFNLEHGFSPDTGAAAAPFWGRQSEVNLSSNLGTLRVGSFLSEAYLATADYISMHNHDTGTSADALYAYAGYANSSDGRRANKVAYRTPSMGGATVEASVSLGEGAVGKKKAYDLAANYVTGDLHLGAGYESNDTARQVAVRGLYMMGPFAVGAYVQRDTDGMGVGLGDRTTFRMSGMYGVGASEFHLNVGRSGNYSKVAGDSAATQATVAYNYKLSKRTKAYAFYTRVNAGNTTPYAKDFDSVAVGVRHNF